MTAVLLCAFLLALLGMPLFAAIGGIAAFLFFREGISISALTVETYRLASSPTLVTIPLFTFAGYVMAKSQAPARLTRLARALVGPLPGGVAGTALVSCAVFTALTGASGVTILALGGLLLPLLRQAQYSERFSLGLITTSGSLGLLFPPSLPLILYAIVGKVDVESLFAAGLVPGVLLIALLSLYGVRRGVAVARPRFSVREALSALRGAAFEAPLPLFILGGIYGGVVTVTEAAVCTALWAIVAEFFIYKDLNFRRDLLRVTRESMVLVGGIFLILGCALGLTNYMIDQEVPTMLFDWLSLHISSPIAFLLILNGFLLIVGCMMDIFSAIVVVVPLIVPIAMEFGVDPVHLGIIFLVNLEIGYSTPPVGLNLFIAGFQFKKPIVTLYRASLPFLAILLGALLLITYVPSISLTLPKLLSR